MEDMKHPLEDSWCIWLLTSENNKWGIGLVNLATFDTVEDWWCLYHHMKLPSELQNGQDYALFKKGITPTWEDDANKNGGRWIIPIDKRASELNTNWVLTVLSLIGATLTHKEAICGAIVNIRSNKRKIGIWVTESTNNDAVLSIGREIKNILGIKGKINFHKHNVAVNMHLI